MAARNKPSLERFGRLAVAREEKKLDHDSGGGVGGGGSTRRGFKTKDFSDQWPLADGEKQQAASDNRIFVESIIADIVRRQAVPELPSHVDLQVLLDLVGSSIELYPESQFYWLKRQMVAAKLGVSAAMNELQFTEKILSVDARNKFAWFHRQATATQRACDLLVMIPYKTMVSLVSAITQMESLTSPSDLKYIQMNVIKKRSEIVNALDALLDLTAPGYELSEEIQVKVQKLRFTTEYIFFAKSIVPVLEFLYPLKAQYWRRRADVVDKMRHDRMFAVLNEEWKRARSVSMYMF